MNSSKNDTLGAANSEWSSPWKSNLHQQTRWFHFVVTHWFEWDLFFKQCNWMFWHPTIPNQVALQALPTPPMHLLCVQLWGVPWSLEHKRLQSLMPWLHLSELVSSCTRFGRMASFEAFRTNDLSVLTWMNSNWSNNTKGREALYIRSHGSWANNSAMIYSIQAWTHRWIDR